MNMFYQVEYKIRDEWFTSGLLQYRYKNLARLKPRVQRAATKYHETYRIVRLGTNSWGKRFYRPLKKVYFPS